MIREKEFSNVYTCSKMSSLWKFMSCSISQILCTLLLWLQLSRFRFQIRLHAAPVQFWIQHHLQLQFLVNTQAMQHSVIRRTRDQCCRESCKLMVRMHICRNFDVGWVVDRLLNRRYLLHRSTICVQCDNFGCLAFYEQQCSNLTSGLHELVVSATVTAVEKGCWMDQCNIICQT